MRSMTDDASLRAGRLAVLLEYHSRLMENICSHCTHMTPRHLDLSSEMTPLVCCLRSTGIDAHAKMSMGLTSVHRGDHLDRERHAGHRIYGVGGTAIPPSATQACAVRASAAEETVSMTHAASSRTTLTTGSQPEGLSLVACSEPGDGERR